jgi:DNA-binding transcriptional ArsR family regulator
VGSPEKAEALEVLAEPIRLMVLEVLMETAWFSRVAYQVINSNDCLILGNF